MRVSTHALSEMGNYRKKTSVYRLGTKVVSKLVLFVKLTISTETVFWSLQSFGFQNIHRISKLRVQEFVEQVQSVLLPEMCQMQDYNIRLKPKIWAGSVHSPVKDVLS